MKKENKIISFSAYKNRNKTKYSLKSKINIHLCRSAEKYTYDCYCQDAEATEDEVLEILKKVFYKLTREIHKIVIKKTDYYDISFTMFFYEDINNSNKYRYIVFPQDINKEKLTEYLYTLISIYEFKKATK